MSSFYRRLLHAALLLWGIAFLRRLEAQTPAALLERFGRSPVATDVTFPVAKDLPYRIAWGINAGPVAADSIVPDLRKPANFLFLAERNGIPARNVHLAIVIWGTATQSLLGNDAYRALTGTENASAAVLEALHDAGVEIIVCGEALINRRIARADLLPFVKVAPTAMLALATLHAQGYATWLP